MVIKCPVASSFSSSFMCEKTKPHGWAWFYNFCNLLNLFQSCEISLVKFKVRGVCDDFDDGYGQVTFGSFHSHHMLSLVFVYQNSCTFTICLLHLDILLMHMFHNNIHFLLMLIGFGSRSSTTPHLLCLGKNASTHLI